MARRPPYIGGAYVTYSELFDRRPAWAELQSILRPLHPLHTVLTFARINTYVRHAFQNGNAGSIGWTQGFLVRNVIGDDALERLKSRFPSARMEDRPIFHPIQLLNMVRVSAFTCQGDEDMRPDLHERLRYEVGTACLMMNDLLLTKEEEMRILEGPSDQRREHLMVQMVAPFELMNPQEPRNLLFRSHVLYRILLKDAELQGTLRRECRGLDFEKSFESTAGISLNKWLSLVFAAYSYYLGRTREELIQQPEFFIINRTSFIRQSGVSQREMDSFLATVSMSFDELRSVAFSERPVDPRFDLVPFRSRPLFVTAEGNFACTDVALLLEKMHSGPHWLVHGAVSKSARYDLFKAWGLIFQAYVHWLLVGAAHLPAAFFPFPKWNVGGDPFDSVFTRDSILAPMEYKGGFVSQEGKYGGSVEALTTELERKIVPGCHQLSCKIASLFDRDPARRRALVDVPTKHITRVLPILVVQDHGLRGPDIEWWLGRRFKEIMSSKALVPGVEMLPLIVVNIEDLERLVESGEAAGFDFIYALHHKAVCDPDSVYLLHNFLYGMSGYPTRGSNRAEAILEEMKSEMFPYLFPGRIRNPEARDGDGSRPLTARVT